MDPFSAEILDGRLFGRGVADMKGAIAAFLYGLERFLKLTPNPNFDISLLISGDEETSCKGTPALLEYLNQLGCSISWCIVGEPSSSDKLADCVRVGRRGSVSCKLKIFGVQGHVAYPQLASNPIHLASRVVSTLINYDFDSDFSESQISVVESDEGWPQTSLQITHFASGIDGATNVIPADVSLAFNIRYRMPHTRDSLIATVEKIINETTNSFEVVWSPGSLAFSSVPGALRTTVSKVVRDKMGYIPRFSRDGGTSDGRFISAVGSEVLELGPINETIHKVDENLEIIELSDLSDLYLDILKEFNARTAK